MLFVQNILVNFMVTIFVYRYACDIKVIRLLRERTLGNSSTRLVKQLKEQHSEAWLTKCLQYLTECNNFKGYKSKYQEPPTAPTLPTYKWILHVYAQDILLRLDEVKAQITCVFGNILKFDSTKKVSK